MTGTSKRTKEQQAFIEEGFKEADDMERAKLEANADIGKLIDTGEKAIASIVVNGVTIRHRAFIPRPLRRELVAASQVTDNSDLNAVERVLYTTIAKLCIDPPFNTPQAWSYVEEKGGDAASILAEIMANISAQQGKVKDFRRK